jgi:hypothetical protein
MANAATHSPNELKNNLAHFIGSEAWYKHSNQLLITEGMKYLADETRCYWLIDLVGSYLPQLVDKDWFFVVEFSNNTEIPDNFTITMADENGHDSVVIRETILETDLPLDKIKLYLELGSLNGQDKRWILMLPSER